MVYVADPICTAEPDIQTDLLSDCRSNRQRQEQHMLPGLQKQIMQCPIGHKTQHFDALICPVGSISNAELQLASEA